MTEEKYWLYWVDKFIELDKQHTNSETIRLFRNWALEEDRKAKQRWNDAKEERKKEAIREKIEFDAYLDRCNEHKEKTYGDE